MLAPERPSQTAPRFALPRGSTLACSWTRAEDVLFPQLTQPVIIEPRAHVLLAKMAEDALIIRPVNRPDRVRLKLIHQRDGLRGDDDLRARSRRGKQIRQQGDRGGMQAQFRLI